jgi:hypothetical protein
MDGKELVRLARVGAAARLAELERERAVLLRAFPDLRRDVRDVTDDAPAAARPKRRRRGMSAAARKAVSNRMKKYWAERRAKRKARTS